MNNSKLQLKLKHNPETHWTAGAGHEGTQKKLFWQISVKNICSKVNALAETKTGSNGNENESRRS
jgi:hypothetical protein